MSADCRRYSPPVCCSAGGAARLISLTKKRHTETSMRKSLVAIALACAFPAAYAQSSVTVYGILDAGFEALDAGDTTAYRVQGAGMWSGNRFGFRGSENLGGGYSAIFTLEGRLTSPPVAHLQRIGELVQAVRRDHACRVSRRDCRAWNGDCGAAADQSNLPGHSRRTERHQQLAGGDHNGQRRRRDIRPAILARHGHSLRGRAARSAIHAGLRAHKQVQRDG